MNTAVGAVSGTQPFHTPPTLAVGSATGVDAVLMLAGPGARAMAFMVDWLLRSAGSLCYLLIASLVLLGNLSSAIRRRSPRCGSSPACFPDDHLFPVPVILEP